MTTDPVCGMKVNTRTAPAESTYQNKTYYFCGQPCKEEFDMNPEQYAGQEAEEPVGSSSRGKRG